jgi:hypothetical protein
MSQEDFDSFRQLVFADAGLQRALRDISDHEVFVERLVNLAAQRGLAVHADDVDEALRGSRRAWLEQWI